MGLRDRELLRDRMDTADSLHEMSADLWEKDDWKVGGIVDDAEIEVDHIIDPDDDDDDDPWWKFW